MKSTFREWYRPDDRKIQDFVVAGTIALDANILLSLYRVSDSQRRQILEVLEMVSDRIWVPYQAAFEYQRNRLTVVSYQQKVHESISALTSSEFNSVHASYINAITDMRSKAVKDIRDREVRASIEWEFDNAIDSLNKAQSACLENMTSALEKIRVKHTVDFQAVKKSDPIRAALDSVITDSRIGKRVDADTLAARTKLARERIAEGIPPGYGDQSKEDATGDCLIWFELLDFAKSSGTPLLYITDDIKDAYQKVRGQIIGPDVRLVREMYEVSGQDYHQTTLDGFLRLARKYLRASVSDDTIQTVASSQEIGDSGLEFGKVTKYVTANASDGARLPGFLIELMDEQLNPVDKQVFVMVKSREWLDSSGVRILDYVVLKKVAGLFGAAYEIVGPLVNRRTGVEKPVKYPANCNACGSRLILVSRESGEWLECTDESCREKLTAELGP